MPTALLPPATTAPSGLEQRIAAIRRALTSRNLTSLYFLLPLMFQVRRWPMTLNDHYVFEPLYNMQVPERILLKAGRQLGKTLNTCASDLIFGATTPGLSTLVVCPRFEQSRRISNLNMRPLLQYSPVHELLVNENCVQRENQRDLANGAVFHFSFAFLDAERVRSISADRLWIDESLISDTTILPTQKTIAELKRGDPIDTFSPEGYIVPSILAKDPSYHGKRHCFRLTTASGKVVEGTMDHLLATSKGWMRIGEIIEYVGSGPSERTTDSTGAGHLAGGRQSFPNIGDSRRLQLNTQQQAARVQPGQVSDIIRVLQQSAKDHREQGLRQILLSLVHPLATDLCLLVHPDLPQRAQDGDAGLAGAPDDRGPGLVVSGRRYPVSRPEGDDRNEQLQRAGVEAAGATPAREAGPGDFILPGQTGLLDAVLPATDYPGTAPADQAVHTTVDAVQTGLGTAAVHDLRERGATAKPGQFVQRGLPSGNAAESSAEIRERPDQPREKSAASAPALPGESGTVTGAGAGDSTALPGESPCGNAATRARALPAAERRSGLPRPAYREPAAVLPDGSQRSRTLGSAPSRRQCASECPPPERPGLAGEADPTSAGMAREAGLAPDPLVRIEYTGVKDVWDIETVGTHTYFANGIASHNCQDMNWDFLPLLQETLSGSPNWGTMRFSGTPKTLENTMERLWQKSSCAELAVRCAACNHWNIGSLEEDLLRNLGPTTTVCSKCGKVIDPRQAVFIHRHPARRALFPGYHISQPYHPFFFANPRKWRRLMANYRDYPFARFCNECLGESQDMASRLISSSDIKKACRSYDMSLELAARRRQDYRMTALAIDWGGGGLESSSYTVPILIAQPPGRDYLDVLFAARLNKNATPIQECRYIMELFKLLNPTFVCHDFTGAGNIREALLIQMGMPKNRIMPFTYVGPNNRPTIYWKPASEAGVRASYEIDKARSLLTLSQMFKAGKIRLPRYEQIAPFANDLLSLVEERNDDRPGADRTLISKVAESTDDFAHALNYGASGIWHALGTYPSLKEAAALEQDVRTMTAVLQDRLQVEDPGA